MRLFVHVLTTLLVITTYCSSLVAAVNNSKAKFNTIENLQNEKEFKKVLRTKNNVLVLFTNGAKENQNVLKVFRETSEVVKGLGTHVVIDCTSGELKKFCKKLKVVPQPYVIKHYKDGDFHKEYDRQMTVTSMGNFMRDPTGDLPWEEDAEGVDVVHLPDTNVSAMSVLHRPSITQIPIISFRLWQNC